MRHSKLTTLSVLLFALVFSLNLYAKGDKDIQKKYTGKKEIKVKLVLGDCYLKKSSDNSIHVHLVHSYDDDNFEPIFKEKGKSIYLREKFHGNNPGGHSKWTIAVPEGMEIDFESATGDFYAEGISKAEIDGSTGTGDIEIKDSEGEFDLNTGTGYVEVAGSKGDFDLNSGTGKVKIENSKGNFDANSGTGDVKANNITIEEEGDFNSGTGDVEITLPKGENYDLSINSGTGDAVLNMDGQPIEGYFEFTANARSGRISSPVNFDKEEEYLEGDNEYLRKSFTKGKKTPRFFISTGTGKAKLER